MRSFMKKILVTLVLFLLVSSAAVRAETNAITLENQTYTPMHYRVRAVGGSYSDWRVVLPGESKAYSEHERLEIDIWFSKDRSEEYLIRRGRTYSYQRSRPQAAPGIITSDGPSPKI